MTGTDLPFPRRGINENWAFGDQPGETTREAQNVRSIDPTNGRTRGAQRAGMSKHKPLIVGSTRPVRLVRTAIYDAKTVTYEALQGDLDVGSLELTEQKWAKTTEAQDLVQNVATDHLGNVYAITGKSVEKRNPDGALLWAFTVPVGDPDFEIGPLAVAADLGIYVATDSGGATAEGSSIFKVEQIPVVNTFDTEPQLAWAWQVDKWVRELRLHQGTLKCLLQDDTAYRSQVMTLVNINLPIPQEQDEIEVPYPSTCMVIKDDGSVVTGHPVFTDRDSSPKQPGVGISLEQWTSKDLDDYENRVWAEYRAQDLKDNGLAEGDLVSFWPDRTGKGRNLTSGSWPSGGEPGAPTLRAVGSTGFPSVFFNGAQGLFSLPGGGTEAQKEACKTMVPNHGDGAYCVMIVCRPSSQKTAEEKDDNGAAIDATRWLFQQFTHTAYQGHASAAVDVGDYTEAHRSGIVLNSAPPTSSGAYHYSWSGKSNGEKDKLGSFNSPGNLHAFTPSTGSTGTTSTVDGSSDLAVAPVNQGAGWAGWPKEGRYDDPTSTDPGEGLCVITFMNCGGLDEALESAGAYVNNTTFTATDTTAFDRYPVGATGTIYEATGVTSDTVTVASGSVLTVGSANIPTTASGTFYIVWERNFMSRSLLRINGEPIDRWEALPMSYAGPSDSGSNNRSAVLNVEQNPTGLGYPLKKKSKPIGMLGEIMEIEVFGRREANSARVTLGGTAHVLFPAVLDHPMYAANGHAADTSGDDFGSHDKAWINVGTNLLSTELEKLEGEKMHRHGISSRLHPSAETATQVDLALDANDTASVTTTLATGGRQRVKLTVAADTGSHGGTHVLTVQTSEDDATWTSTTITVTGDTNANGTITARYVRAKVTTAEGGASTVDVTIVMTGYPHPHYPDSGTTVATYDIPVVSNITDTGQAWLPRKRSTAAMIIKHDQAGKMLWCLLSDTGTGFGDIVSEGYNGNEGVIGVTDAPSTGGLAVTSTGDIFFAGPGSVLQPVVPLSSEHFALGLITDVPITEENPRLTSVGFWRLSGDAPPDDFKLGFAADQIIRLVVDEYDSLYVPVPPGTQYDSADAKDAIRVYGRAEVTDSVIPLLRLTTLGGTSKYQNAYAVALPPVNPDYLV